MSEINFSQLTKVELDNVIDVILMLYEWDKDAQDKSDPHVPKNRTYLESMPTE
jgi:hypothetical protein